MQDILFEVHIFGVYEEHVSVYLEACECPFSLPELRHVFTGTEANQLFPVRRCKVKTYFGLKA
jgi:hypothetical protein